MQSWIEAVGYMAVVAAVVGLICYVASLGERRQRERSIPRDASVTLLCSLGRLASRVRHWGPDMIEIEAPVFRGTRVPVRPGTRCQLQVGFNGMFWAGRTTVQHRDAQEGTLQLVSPARLVSLERRSEPRSTMLFGAPCKVDDITGTILDTSPRGAKLLLSGAPHPGDEYRVVLDGDAPRRGVVLSAEPALYDQYEGSECRLMFLE